MMKDARSWAANLFAGFVALVVVGFALTSVAAAASIPITNFSFEDPVLADSGWSPGVATGWTASVNAGAFNPRIDQLPQGPTQGLQVGYSNNVGEAFSQTVGAVLTANTIYTLVVDIQSRADNDEAGPNQSSTLVLRTVGGFVLGTSTIAFPIPPSGANAEQTTSFTALPGDIHLGETLQIALISGGNQSDWDNVRLDASPTAAVPEPTTMLLWGTTAVGLAIVRRRRRSRSLA